MISIQYNENDRKYETSYKAVHASDKTFNSGDVTKDFLEACQYEYQKTGIILMSSSCDHFVNDVDGFGWLEMIVRK